MNFWNFGEFVSWEGCIEAGRLCNLDNCPDTMNCCAVNCIGMPTISGVLLIILITSIIGLIAMIVSIKEETKSK